jgi:ribosomal protein S18 acetylase RimI-like enzyme
MSTTLRPRILPLQEEWLHVIPQMIRSWFNPDVWPLTVFSCPGYVGYLRENVKIPAEQRPQLLFGAFVSGRLAGFAEWRRMPDSLLLNNIFVSPGHRGSGLGRMLIESGRKLAGQMGLPAVELDVFTWEPKTVRWYREMGFSERYRRHWYTGGNPFVPQDGRKPGTGRSPSFILEGFPQAEACHKAFGFSTFDVRTDSGVHQVGRLHQRYFRLQGITAEPERDLLAGLAELDPGRQLFIISPEAKWTGSIPMHSVCTSIRFGLGVTS